MRIFTVKSFTRFARREGVSRAALIEAVDRAMKGQIDADLGGGVLKQRVARPGEGRSGGFRTILLFKKADRAIFVFGFAKSERANLKPDELDGFKKLAETMLGLSEKKLDDLVKHEGWTEVGDGEKVSK